MPVWKILLVLVLAVICLGLAFATLIVPLALTAEDNKWLWFAGLLAGTILMGTLFVLFLRKADETFGKDRRRGP
jgi:hypothetical protein